MAAFIKKNIYLQSNYLFYIKLKLQGVYESTKYRVCYNECRHFTNAANHITQQLPNITRYTHTDRQTGSV